MNESAPDIPDVKTRLAELRTEYTDTSSNQTHYGAMTAEHGYIELERQVNDLFDFWAKRGKNGPLSASDQRASDRAAAAYADVMEMKDAAVEEMRREREDRERRARAAAGVNFSSADGRRRSGARGRAIDNVERSRADDNLKQRIVQAVEADADVAETVAVRSDPNYLSGWLKWVRDPQMGHLEWTPLERSAWTAMKTELRAAMLESGSASAGVPTILDPLWTITGAGIINPMRRIGTLKKTTSNNWKGITAAQISASFDTEGSAVSDDSPTLVQPSITIFTGRAYVNASFEAFEDIADIAGEIGTMFADAKANLEGSSFATGGGSSDPKGVVTAVTAVTASRVSPTTGGAYALADVYKVQNALPARFSAGASWLASLTVINLTRRFGEGTTGSNSAFWADLGADSPPQLLGRPLYEYSAMSTSITTGQNVLLYGDFSRYTIVDHVRGTVLEYVPMVMDQATGRPNATRGWLMHWRTGADMVDADAARILKL
jgi:HK97 family phage major capsid protein